LAATCEAVNLPVGSRCFLSSATFRRLENGWDSTRYILRPRSPGTRWICRRPRNYPQLLTDPRVPQARRTRFSRMAGCCSPGRCAGGLPSCLKLLVGREVGDGSAILRCAPAVVGMHARARGRHGDDSRERRAGKGTWPSRLSFHARPHFGLCRPPSCSDPKPRTGGAGVCLRTSVVTSHPFRGATVATTHVYATHHISGFSHLGAGLSQRDHQRTTFLEGWTSRRGVMRPGKVVRFRGPGRSSRPGCCTSPDSLVYIRDVSDQGDVPRGVYACARALSV